MKKRTFKISDILFVTFIALFLIPQTRKPFLVIAGKVRAKLSPLTVVAREEREQLEPFVYHLKDLDDGFAQVPIGKGNIVFLSYWATWCPPCIAEFPSIAHLYADYGNRVEFVLISNEDPQNIRRFLKERNFSLPVFVPNMKAPKELYEKTIPTNYIIDHKGKIVVKEQGASDWNSPKIRQALDKLLQESSNAQKQKTLSNS